MASSGVAFHNDNRDQAISSSIQIADIEPHKPFIVVAVPCLNEEVGIGSVVLRSLKYADKVVVIDDGSIDRTAEIAKLAGAEIITHEKNMGKGAGIKDAFDYAKKANADILVLIDGDGQHNPDEIPQLIKPVIDGEADIVNGSRFLVKNGFHIPAYRRIGQEVLTLATNAGMNKHITDTQNGFRAFSKETFDSFSFRQNGMAIESEMLMDASKDGMRIKEVPINVRYDVDGSSMNPISHGIGVLNPILGLISQRRPLLSFGLPGTFLLIVGVIFCLLVLSSFNDTHQVAIGYAMIFILCTIIGIFSIFTGLMLWSINNVNQNWR